MLERLHWAPDSASHAPSPACARWMSKNSHSHEYDEIIVSLIGNHNYGIGGRLIRFSPGRAALIPARTPHDCWYGANHSPCVDFWFHILPHGNVTANYIDHNPGRELISTPIPGFATQFQEDFSRAATLLRSSGTVRQKKARHFLLYLLHEVFEHLMTANFVPSRYGDSTVIEDVKLYAASHLTDRLTLQDLAKAAGYSPFHFHRLFLEAEGVTPRAFVEACRLKNACSLLKEGFSITSAAMDSGFSTASQFACIFKKKFELSPSQWLKISRQP